MPNVKLNKLAASMLVAAIMAGAQSVKKTTIDASPSPQVTLLPFDAAVFPAFKEVFDSRTAGLAAASVVVSNATDKAIIGISIQWTLTDAAGVESVYSNRTHSFLVASGRPLALPHGRLLAGPQTFVSEAVLPHPDGGIIAPLPNDQTVARFTTASKIRIEVDSIIFQDGEVIGPDHLGLVDAIRDRSDAARAIVKRVEEAQAKGNDPAQALRSLVASPVMKGDHVARFELGFANSLLHARHPERDLEALKEIPTPPLFFRKESGPIWQQ
jgi:hypothetical protein